MLFCLVREFLEFFQLDFTNMVFEKESYMGILYDYKGKERLVKDLEIGVDNITQMPLLLEVLNAARSSYKNSTKNESVHNTSSFINESNMNVTYEVPSNENIEKLPNVDELDSPRNISGSSSVEEKNQEKNSDSSNVSMSSVESNGKHSKILQEEMNNKKCSEKTAVEDEALKPETDDTYEGTSSIAEDSIVTNNKEAALIDFDKATKTSTTNSPIASSKCLIDQTMEESTPTKSPRLHSESSKKLDKSDKPKPMSGLSSLSDLPPLQVTKTRSPDTVLLPSLYSKDRYRERSNLKEIDKLLDLNFDSIDNYEEDFILTASIDNERNKNINSILSKSETSKHFSPIKLFDHENRSFKYQERKNADNSTSSDRENNSAINNSSNSHVSENIKDPDTTSISEDLDFNSNSDEILKSNNT